MNVSRSRLNILALAILLAGLTLSGVWAEAAAPAPAQVPISILAGVPGDSTASLTVLSGEVTIRLASTSDWQRVLDSSPVEPGDTIRTAVDGRALLTFYEVAESLIDSNTEMTVESLLVPRGQPFDIKLRLIAGSAWHNVPNFFCFESRYEVDTPSATLARGTTWWAYVDNSRHTWVNVLEGQVDMTGDYTIGIPNDLPSTSTARTLSEQITWIVEHTETINLPPQPAQSTNVEPPDSGVTNITIDVGLTDTKTQHVGLGVLAQATFIAHALTTEQRDDLGCADDLDCTWALVEAKVQKTMSWGDIKKLVDEHGSLGVIRSGRADSDLVIPPELLKKDNGGNQGNQDDKGNQGNQGDKDDKDDKGNQGGKGDQSCQPGDPCWPIDKKGGK